MVCCSPRLYASSLLILFPISYFKRFIYIFSYFRRALPLYVFLLYVFHWLHEIQHFIFFNFKYSISIHYRLHTLLNSTFGFMFNYYFMLLYFCQQQPQPKILFQLKISRAVPKTHQLHKFRRIKNSIKGNMWYAR